MEIWEFFEKGFIVQRDSWGIWKPVNLKEKDVLINKETIWSIATMNVYLYDRTKLIPLCSSFCSFCYFVILLDFFMFYDWFYFIVCSCIRSVCTINKHQQVASELGSMWMARFDPKKFTGKNDFRLWRIKMWALLIQQDLQDTLLKEKNLTFCNDKVLREIVKEDIATRVWLKLETLYMIKFLANRRYKKTRLFTFKMAPGTFIEQHFDEFNKIILNLTNIDINIDEVDNLSYH